MPRPDPFAHFTARVKGFRASGTATAELSYYPAVGDLLDDAASGLSVVAMPHPSAEQGKSADLGLFAKHQLAQGAIVGGEAWERQMPEHGVVEVKSPGEPIETTVASDQVQRYTRHYGKTIVTNLRDWRTVTLLPDGRTVTVDDGITLAADEASFWALIAGDASKALVTPQALLNYLHGAIQEGAPVTSAKALAKVLATHARRALHNVETSGSTALDPLRRDLEQTLGVTFSDEQAVRFFRSGLVQTLFYGLFATWVLTARETTERFNWKTVSYDLRLPPIIQTLFENYAKSSNVTGLGIAADLDRAGDALNRVVQDRFFEQFEHGTAIEYFYEPFLDAYDPGLRSSLGVWYTPRPVADYIVEEVDRRLRADFGLPLGLADERVVVLDPATGTGTFLSACLRRISRTLLGYDPEDPAGHDPATVDGLAAADIRTAATTRLFGFELLPAPFVVAHLRLGITLHQLGVPLPAGTRAGVYLTNSLTGWDPTADPPATLYEALGAERDSATAVKRDTKVLVILGNPPYNAYAGVGVGPEETDLIAPYKVGIRGRNSLDDLYVRFFRVAERRVAEMTGQGVVAYVTNRSYLRKPSFRTMRQHLLASFDTVDVTDLNGDRDETGKRTPSGRPDPSVFTTGASDGIAEGTAIAVMARRPGREADAPQATVTYRSVWGRTKADDLGRISRGEDPEDAESDTAPRVVDSNADNFHAFQPVVVGARYYHWTALPDLTELPPEYGLHEARGGGLIAMDRKSVEERMAAYLDPSLPDADLPVGCAPLRRAWSGFDPATTRQRLTGQGPGGSAASRRPYGPGKVRSYMAGPLDRRYAYVEPDHNLWVAPQRRLVEAHDLGAWFLYAQRTVESERNGMPVFASRYVGDQHVLHKTAFLVPNRLPADPEPTDEVLAFEGEIRRPARPNLSAASIDYLLGLGLDPTDQDDADLLFLHTLAFVNAPLYSEQHGDSLRQQYPRVLLPATVEQLRASATLGGRVKTLLDEDALQPAGPLLDRLGALRKTSGPIDPTAGDLAVTVAWGALQQGAVMPRTGRSTTAAWSPEDRAAAAAQGMGGTIDGDGIEALLGNQMVTVELNDSVRLERVPTLVWQAAFGGRNVIKKWLSYRTKAVLGRDLTTAEARHLTRMTQSVAALLLLAPALDESYTTIVTGEDE